MISNITDYSDLIPEYQYGLLTPDMKALFEEELTKNGALQIALEEFNDFQQLYQELDSEEPQADDLQFDAIVSSIDAGAEKKNRLSQKNQTEPTAIANVLEFWDWLKTSLTIPWGVALVQMVAIVILLLPGTNQDTFETLSRNSSLGAAHSSISFNIVFQKSAQEKEIRELLLSIGGSITSGPSVQGLYVIALSTNAPIPKVTEILTGSNIIVFSKRAY